jgi:citronellol/citronellal dehydrogenase
MLSPPLDLRPEWFEPHLGYSLTKYGMSLCVLGLSAELADRGIAVNALWPKTAIATSAIRNLLGGDAVIRASRKPEIVADAAYLILTQPSRAFTGRFVIDEDILAEHGMTDFAKYRVDPAAKLARDFFVDGDPR